VLAKCLLVDHAFGFESLGTNQASSPLKHSVEFKTTLLGISQQRDNDTEASCFVHPQSLDHFWEWYE
jgi:hypothetical protein